MLGDAKLQRARYKQREQLNPVPHEREIINAASAPIIELRDTYLLSFSVTKKTTSAATKSNGA